MLYFLLILVALVATMLLVKRRHTRILKPNNFNPPRDSLPGGSFIIEAYCYGEDGKLYFITLNYPTWDDACKIRNDIATKEFLTIEYEGRQHHYSVLSTKISRVSAK